MERGRVDTPGMLTWPRAMVTHQAMLPWDWAITTQCEHAVMAPGHGDTSGHVAMGLGHDNTV